MSAAALSKALPASVREIRLLCCQSSQASAGLRSVSLPAPSPCCFVRRLTRGIDLDWLDRQFIRASYPALKDANPYLPILIREAPNPPARAFARFGPSRFPTTITGLRLGTKMATFDSGTSVLIHLSREY